MRCPLGCFGPAEGTPLNSLEPHFTPNLHVATPQVRLNVSAPNPGDVLPLWNPEIPGEEIQAGRLGIRIRPGSPAAAKLAILPDGPEWPRQTRAARGGRSA